MLKSNFRQQDEIIMQTRALSGKTALITGSTSGIGLGIAHALAQAGANLLINGFASDDEIRSLIEQLETKHQVRVEYHGADMSQAGQIQEMMEYASHHFGKLDIVVNNAGIQHVAAIEEFPTEKWDAILAINLSSAFHTTRLALPEMRKQNWGRIINIASVHGLVASAQKSAYVAAKHGLVGLTKTIALETAQTNITCNAICPGFVLTPLVQKQVDAKAHDLNVSNEVAKQKLLSEKQPSGEFVTPEQLGNLAVFFCSEAASQVRGVAWNMDGGWAAQ